MYQFNNLSFDYSKKNTFLVLFSQMGCTLDTGMCKKQFDKAHQNRRGRIGTIDTRRISRKVADNVSENVTLSNQSLTSAQIKFAKSSLHNQSLFSSLSEEQLNLITSLLVHGHTNKDQYVFQQGDQGNCFFLIQHGEISVEIDGKVIKTLKQGQTFGEIALILKTKRSASIKTKTYCKFLIMKPLIFRETIEKLKTNEYEVKRNSIEKVEIFEGLTNKQKLNLSNALKILIYEKGERIIIKNQLANAFYIINEGKVVVDHSNKGEEVYLTKNDCFGESAFRTKGRRKHSVIAIERTVCSIISKEDFEKSSGTKAENIYFFNLRKWALTKSEIFKNQSTHVLNAINLAFEVQYAQRKTKIRNNGLVICLEGRINNISEGEHIFGEKEWKEGKQLLDYELVQQEDGFYAYLNFKTLNTLLKNIQKRKQNKNMVLSMIASSKDNQGSMDLSNFVFIRDLGQGQFGSVKLIRDPNMQRLYALKQISKSMVKKQGLEFYVEQERRILQKIEFPFIMGFVKAFSDEQYVYFLMEYIKGVELFSVIRELPSLNKPIARYFFASIMLSIQHLHLNGIIYRDIKPENSVVDHTGKVYLIDMGTAKFLKKEKSYRTFTIIGTPHYMSPEVFLAQGYSFESDIWSLGVLMYEFLCNRLPFGEDQQDAYRVMEKIKKQEVKYPNNLQPQAQLLLKLMLNKNSKQRAIDATFQKIKQADYFKGFNWSDMLKEKIYPPYVPKEFKKQGSLKTINIQGKPLTKVLYPEEYRKNIPIIFKEWNDNISF